MAVKFLNINRIKRLTLRLRSGSILSSAEGLKLLIIICAICIVAIVLSFPNYIKLKKIREGNARLRLENKQLEKEITDYEDKIQSVGKDPYLYERIARDDLGVAKENEIVIDIE